jgi:signal transduction histidine kinase
MKNKLQKLHTMKLKWRVFGFLFGFCLLLLLILWLFQIVFLDNFYRYIRVTEIRNNASIIISHISDEDLPDIVTNLSEDGDFIVDIVNLEGRSLFRPYRQNPQVLTLNTTLIARALENRGEFYEYSTAQPSQTIRTEDDSRPDDRQQFGRPLDNRRPDNRQQLGRPLVNRRPVESLLYVRLAGDSAVIIYAVVSPVQATVTTLRYQLYMISGIMLILAILLAIIIAKRVSRPIEEISHSALDLAKGRYDTRFSGKGFYEIVELSETLNTAAIELGKTETLRRELLANVSHDLRTPLALIYSHAEMMHDFPGDFTKEQAGVIMEETRRLTSLVNDVLDISKLEASMERLHAARFDLTKSLGEAVERMRELLKNQDYTIDFTHDENVFIEADETMINRAFYNLLINAVTFAGDDRRVSVTQKVSGSRVKISVTDNGDGISETDLPFIWDRYYKSGKAHKRAVAGTGLGLSIVKKIIELHRGTYGVASETGKGSTFWFELNR